LYATLKGTLMDYRLKKIIDLVKEEIANTASGGSIAGLPPDEPPVRKKKRKPTPVGRYGSRKMWIQNLKGNGRS